MEDGRELDKLIEGKLFTPQWADEPDSLEMIAPKYSTNIADAWKIVEKLCSSFYIRLDDSSSTWIVNMDRKRRLAEDCRGNAFAFSAPHAICLAALELIEK